MSISIISKLPKFSKFPITLLFLKDKEDRQDKAGESCEMVPAQRLALHKESDQDCKDEQRDNLLDNFEFPDVERTTEIGTAEAVGRHLQTILKECYQPAEYHNGIDAKSLQARLEHNLSVPSQGHKGVRADQKEYRANSA